MSPESKITSHVYYNENGKKCKSEKEFNLTEISERPTDHSQHWRIEFSNKTSLFWSWFVSRHQKRIQEHYRAENVSGEFGVDLAKFLDVDEEEIIRRLKE